MNETIELIGIEKSWPDFRLSVDFSVGKGDFACILGPSGSGKTTVLRLIAGLELPDAGSIRAFGEDIGRFPPEKRNIGLVFQDLALFPHLDVSSNVAYGLKAKGLTRIEIARRVNFLLGNFGLAGFAKRSVYSLSGGEQQRVALARAMAPEPKVLLFDEPLSSVDASMRKELRREIRSFVKKAGLTAIYVTHDQEEALAISDAVILMKGGRVERTGTPDTVYLDPGTRFAAEFIGEGNCIPALKIAAPLHGDTGFLVHTELCPFAIGGASPAGISGELEYDGSRSRFFVFFRRENIRIGKNEGKAEVGENCFPAVLESYEYLGRTYLCFFRAKGMVISAECPFEGKPTPGDSYLLRVPREGCGLVNA